MTNVTQANIQLTVPKIALNDIPTNSLAVRGVTELFERIIQPDELKEYIPLAAKAYFLPLILTTMIERDITFKGAVNYSRERFGGLYDHVKEMIKDHNIKDILTDMIKDFFEAFKDIPEGTNFLDKDKEMITIVLQNVTAEMNDTFERTQILNSARMIAEDSVIRSTIKRCKLDPLYQEIEKAAKDFCKRVEIEEEYITAIIEEFKTGIEQEYLLIPLSVIVSEVIAKAIEKDIRFSEAIAYITSNIYNKIIEGAEKAADLNKKTAAYEKVITNVFDTIYALMKD